MTDNLPADALDTSAIAPPQSEITIPPQHMDGDTLELIRGGLLQNPYTRMGLSSSSMGTSVGVAPRLDEFALRQLYIGNWLLARVIDLPAEDMTKAGFDLTITDGDETDAQQVMAKYRSINEMESEFEDEASGDDIFCEAERWARLFGQSYVIVRANGNENPSLPLRNIRSIEGLTVLDRYQLHPAPGELNPINPRYYQLAVGSTDSDVRLLNRSIHRSRVLKFVGAPLPRVDAIANGGCADSVIQRMYEVFARHYGVKDAIAEGLSSFSLLTVAIAGLADLIGKGQRKEIKQHLREIALTKSLHKILVTDSDVEKPGLMGRNFSGVADNVEDIIEELTAASGLSFYKLWGTVGRAGLGDSRVAEEQAHADWIWSQQMARHHDNHRRLIKMIMALELGQIPEKWDIQYRSIRKLNDVEVAELKEKEAQRIQILANAGPIVAPSEFRRALATGQQIENVIDLENTPTDLQTSGPPPGPVRLDSDPELVKVNGKALSNAEWDNLSKVSEVDVLAMLEGVVS